MRSSLENKLPFDTAVESDVGPTKSGNVGESPFDCSLSFPGSWILFPFTLHVDSSAWKKYKIM